MIDLILKMANADQRIRAAILTGSRASPSAINDVFSDYDVIFLVNNVAHFVEDQQWIGQFGNILIMQKPDEMDGHWETNKDKFTFLMRFKEGDRIDLTFIQKNTWNDFPKDSQSKLLLDKDDLIVPLEEPSDNNYLPLQPTESAFQNCCNEFLWVSTYVAKGIGRQQLPYAKYMAEYIVKQQLIKLLEWNAAINTNFTTPIGQFGKYLEKYTEPALWDLFLQTYVGCDYQDIWKGLFTMCELFDTLARKIADRYGYQYDSNQYVAVVNYLNGIRDTC